MSYILKLKEDKRILEVLYNHFKIKWGLEPYTIALTCLLLSMGIILPIISSLILSIGFNFETIISASIFTCFIGVIMLIALVNRIHISNIKEEIYYARRTISLTFTIINRIKCRFKAYGSSREPYFTQPIDHKDKLDVIILTSICEKIIIMYFDNLNNMILSKDVRTVPIKCFDYLKNNDYRNFYSLIFFDVKKGEKSPFESVVADIFESIVMKLYQQSWFNKDSLNYIYILGAIKTMIDSSYHNIVVYKRDKIRNYEKRKIKENKTFNMVNLL